jgi:hypothetical protein
MRKNELSEGHPAIKGRGTKYPLTVKQHNESPRVLVQGVNNKKIGGRVTKGRWAGMPIYTVTLTERAACPTSCSEWRTCYGNNMRWARRHVLGYGLIHKLGVELRDAAARHPQGFVVRLHVLGDFGTGEDKLTFDYIDFWARALDAHPALHIFGFTAHDYVGRAGGQLRMLNWTHPMRCRIRFSGLHKRGHHDLGSIVIDHGAPVPEGAVRCPQQSGATQDCGTCGLCWTMDKTVAFDRH